MAQKVRNVLTWLHSDRGRRAAYYAAVAALLVILGAASNGYRTRTAARSAGNVDAREPATLSAVAPEPTPTPQPEPGVAWVWPIQGEILAPFSGSAPAWSNTLGQWQSHMGVDIAASAGEVVAACADGVVADAWEDALWGKVIAVEHTGGYVSVYANLETLRLVEIGEPVAAGQAISTVGASADCESSLPWHMHFELKRAGEYVDFQEIMKNHAE